jgi:hypothetical protein
MDNSFGSLAKAKIYGFEGITLTNQLTNERLKTVEIGACTESISTGPELIQSQMANQQ